MRFRRFGVVQVAGSQRFRVSNHELFVWFLQSQGVVIHSYRAWISPAASSGCVACECRVWEFILGVLASRSFDFRTWRCRDYAS